MSNAPVQYKRKKRGKKDPHPIEIDGELFLFAAKIGSKALEPISRLESDNITAMFEAIRALLVERETGEAGEREPDGTAFTRFVDLDLDMEEELPEVFALIIGLYGLTPGESSASSTGSTDDEASSTPTSDGSTTKTSTKLKSA